MNKSSKLCGSGHGRLSGHKRAFTLIELLVVIAIIAILAAILFPVFAQAKAAAKSTASLSNAKQIGLGWVMYQNDYDDTVVPEVVWNSSDAYFTYGTAKGGNFSPWTYELLPYEKNGQIYEDPQTTANPNPNKYPEAVWDAYNPEYSYNYEQLDPWLPNPTGPLKQFGINYSMNGISATTLSKPSQTVVAAASGSSADGGWATWYGIGSPLPWESLEAPFCGADAYTFDHTSYCMGYSGWGSWGIGSYFAGWINTAVAGADTGNLSLRRSNLGVTIYADGHAKAVQPGSLAIGTNWNPTIQSTAVVMSNSSQYLWQN